MITLTRAHVRSLRRLLRAAFRRTPAIPVTFLPTPEGLVVRAHDGQVALEKRLAEGSATGESLTISLAALADCEGKQPDPVTIQAAAEMATFEWTEAGICQRTTHPLVAAPDGFPSPAPTTEWAPQGPAFLAALRAASATTDVLASRYALGCLRVHGRQGSVAATDGRQLFVQSGFAFPFEQELLVPASPVLRAEELTRACAIAVGRTADWFCLKLDDLTLQFRLAEGRFPDVERICRPTTEPIATLEIAEGDAAFLQTTLPRLPGGREPHAPVAIELNGQVVVRARSPLDNQPATELALTGSTRTGVDFCGSTDRAYLARALALGFRRFEFRDTLSPVIGRQEGQVYAWAQLGPESERALAAVTNPPPTRIASPTAAAATPPSSSPVPRTRKEIPMPASRLPKTNPPATNDAPAAESKPLPAAASARSAIAQAESLRAALQTALACSRDLLVELRRERRQTRTLRETLASLRQLPDVA